MNREEQTLAAAQEYAGKKYRNDEDRAFAIKDFQAGAEWADEHPQSPWISVEDRLPENYYTVLLSNEDCRLCTGSWLISSKKWMIIAGDKILNDFIPAYWMPIPDIPNF